MIKSLNQELTYLFTYDLCTSVCASWYTIKLKFSESFNFSEFNDDNSFIFNIHGIRR